MTIRGGSEVRFVVAQSRPPDLPGAACVQRRDVFDEAAMPAAGEYTHHRAIRICDSCPALAACRAWIESLVLTERPVGVTAGLLRRAR